MIDEPVMTGTSRDWVSSHVWVPVRLGTSHVWVPVGLGTSHDWIPSPTGTQSNWTGAYLLSFISDFHLSAQILQ